MNPILKTAFDYLETEVAPSAQRIDQDAEALRTALGGLASRSLLALRRPARYGGPDLPEAEFRAFQEEVARRSGALSFLQTQHQSAVSLIAKGDNQALQEAYLPLMADGRKLVGIGFSQLRRPGPPIMRAEPVTGGYRLEGHVPWVTGWTFFPEFLIAAALPDGSAVFAVVPLVESPGVKLSPAMRLAAMETALTVTADFEQFFVPDTLVSSIQPAGWIRTNDQINVALQRHFALGCAQAGIDIVAAAARAKGTDWMLAASAVLEEELKACREATADVPEGEAATTDRLRARAWAIELAARCAQAAVAVSSGKANSLDHPAQRVYREALVYTVSAQTSAIMEATLERLARRP
ncbi:MAG: acyl-CoA/acyl-ACP dehydrogenase [Fimbriimonas ginsengisoli]|uniref:Acyl-CoA/acyl-ACP dehydrogenase n=1 Tax=Fimbriimonas ginsengisoli TaxID=1005039 RepID=A0A931LTK1_FIMGI|nr:acyl-CoA/acyl-ACP dehydrogenase [Fimbriimonas ginsengisoli]MBI3722045.1 acyl-CoA/acyl-ACP dehydrogenase [Fimbriimonas ginsengisoli]